MDDLLGKSDDEDDAEIEKAMAALKKREGPKEDSDDSSSDEDAGKNKKKILKKKKVLTKKKLTKPSKDNDDEKAGDKDEGDADSFIASDDDQEDILDSYKHQQQDLQSDEDPDEGTDEEDDEKGPKKKSSSSSAAPAEDVDPNSFAGIIASRKRSRNKKEESDEEKREFVKAHIKEMTRCARLDDKCRSKKQPAIHKLRHLDDFVTNLTRKDLQEIMLEEGALEVITDWLRPSPVDQSLPGLKIRTDLINVLARLPKGEDQHERWNRAKVGKIINFLREHSKEERSNKHTISVIMQDWRRSLDKRNQGVPAGAAEEEDSAEKTQKEKVRAATHRRKRQKGPQDALANIGNEAKAKKDPNARQQYRAIIPQAREFDFKKTVTDNLDPEKIKPDSSAAQKRAELEKKLLKIRKKGKSTAA